MAEVDDVIACFGRRGGQAAPGAALWLLGSFWGARHVNHVRRGGAYGRGRRYPGFHQRRRLLLDFHFDVDRVG